MIINSTPKIDGFSMPAEYDVHIGTLMIWPTRPGSWGKDNTAARKAFCKIFEGILIKTICSILSHKRCR